MGLIKAVCISEKKGTVKKDVGECRIIRDFGMENDAHAGSGRQVSLLAEESVDAFRQKTEGKVDLPPGVFGENLLTTGIRYIELPLGTRFKCGDVILELMQIGKTCHSGCEISGIAGECIMPREGVFARVIAGGVVRRGDEISIIPQADRALTAAVMTVSDRSFNGQREDLSGPALCDELRKAGYEVTETVLVPDEQGMIEAELIRLCDQAGPDVIFTTGGTGFAMRDRTPEATMAVADRHVPGIAEVIRAGSMKITPGAMLSRAESAIRGRTLIINLPGSPKAVRESLGFVLPGLEHGLLILRGEADG